LLFVVQSAPEFPLDGYKPKLADAGKGFISFSDQMTRRLAAARIASFHAQAMTRPALVASMLGVIDGAYKAPREWNFGSPDSPSTRSALSLTGYLLPWESKKAILGHQKSRTNLIAVCQPIGPALQKIILGGTDYGHHTPDSLFLPCHAGVLPGAIIALLTGHYLPFP